MKQLGIQHIASYSPQARGRMERVFGTLQGRVPHDLRLARFEDVNEVLYIEEERVVGQDNCVRYHNKTLQIPKDKHRYHYVKTTVVVREYLDKTLALFNGPRLLAGYNRFGESEGQSQKIHENKTQKAA